MANPSKIDDRRRQFTPRVATAFIELGYRGTTTAELAQRCGVRENVLYRIWPTKKAMFLDAVEYVNQFFKDKAKDQKYLGELKKRAADLGVTPAAPRARVTAYRNLPARETQVEMLAGTPEELVAKLVDRLIEEKVL